MNNLKWKDYGKLFLLIFIFISDKIGAQSMDVTPEDVPLLVIDEELNVSKPPHFRSTLEVINKDDVNTEGLASLNIAGSGQFSLNTLKEVLSILPRPLWIVDLRQESHGFVNGIPISWYSDKNQGNLGSSNDNIMRLEEMLFNDIGRQSGVLAHQILEKKEGKIVKSQERNISINQVSTESALVNQLNVNYLRLGTRDHHAPEDASVDEFLNFFKTLPPNATLYFHCRGGRGRSTTFMVMVDILRNGSKVSLNEIVQRQAKLGGSDLFQTQVDEEDVWKKDEAAERKKFIENFYRYVTQRRGYPKKTWTEWNKRVH